MKSKKCLDAKKMQEKRRKSWGNPILKCFKNFLFSGNPVHGEEHEEPLLFK